MKILGIIFCWAILSEVVYANPFISGPARFHVIAPGLVRIEYSRDSKFIDQSSLFAVRREGRPVKIEAQVSGAGAILKTDQLRLEYINDGKPFHAGNLQVQFKFSDGKLSHWTFGQKNLSNLGGTLPSLDYVKGAVALPEGLLSREGWYYLDDSKTPLRNASGWIEKRPEGERSDGYLFTYGQNFKGALQLLTEVGGEIPLPRRYVFGSWYSRWWPFTSDDYKGIVSEFDEHQFPLDMLVLDMDWHKKGWTGYSWDTKLIPNPRELLSWLHDRQVHVTLNDHPQEGIQPHEDMYSEFMKSLGQDPSSKKTVQYDAGDQLYLTKHFEYAQGWRDFDGVDFWWLDWMGDDKRPFNLLPWLNIQYFEHSQRGRTRGLSFSRWGGWGDHRNPIHFSGDSLITWDAFKFQIPFTATAGNVGAAFWSHDIGGFIAESAVWDFFKRKKMAELFARWAQFGVFSPTLRLHSANFFYLDKRPWYWGQPFEESLRRSFQLRAKLIPYVYSTARKTHETALPLNRPLYLEYPQHEGAYSNPQEYLFGDGFLVAPITGEGFGSEMWASQQVWFPPGEWVDWYSGASHKGFTGAVIQKNIFEMPLFVRAGYPVIMQPYRSRPTQVLLSDVVIRIYMGGSGDQIEHLAELYEDDGESKEYLSGAFAKTFVKCETAPQEMKVSVSGRQGNYQDGLNRRNVILEVVSPTEPIDISTSHAWQRLDGDGVAKFRIQFSNLSVTEAAQIKLKF